jgi:hypothetical protein
MIRLSRSRPWRGVLAALFGLVLFAQVQPVMACAYTDSRNPADCPCPVPDSTPNAGCVDSALAPESDHCGKVSIGFVFKTEVRADAAAEAPALPSSPNGPLVFAAMANADSVPVPLTSTAAPAGGAVLSLGDTYLRTLRLRL